MKNDFDQSLFIGRIEFRIHIDENMCTKDLD